ncbi:MAG: Eco57I restriction-modification methylase domain-containing protein [Clostridiales Family XIII bacterium]|nr:Eco57I restriction-modification methylase domain-containing protein [Clostridiales Family XIII bacterium]
MLEETYKATVEYFDLKGKSERKKIGQFFTSRATAEFMGSLFDAKSENVRIADPGAGTGVLSSALLDRIFELRQIKSIDLDLFENDEKVLSVLEENIARWKCAAERKSIKLHVTLTKDNFILYNRSKWHDELYRGEYDFIISNPPYKKIPKSSPEAGVMGRIVHGQPNLYFLFMAMACKLLKIDGELVFIMPRSWTSGLYFKAFRQYFLSNMRIERAHQFVSRTRVFEHEDVLQETIILKAKKTQERADEVVISSSAGTADFTSPGALRVPYYLCVKNTGDRFVYLPTSAEELEILSEMESFKDTLLSLGFRMKTGPTVDFRTMESIHDEAEPNDFPLLWAQHFSSGRIRFPVSDAPGQYISSERKALLIDKDNYLLVKRFSSKEEKRRLQPAILLSTSIPGYDKFSAENHLNYITNSHGGLDVDEVYGLYVIFNSTLWDRYYRILNGSTQVNATECNSFPMPDLQTVRKLGVRIQGKTHYSTEVCDTIIREEFSDHRRRKNDFVRTGYAAKATV